MDLNELLQKIVFKDVYKNETSKESQNNISPDNDPFSAIVQAIKPDTTQTGVPDTVKTRVDSYRHMIVEKSVKYGIDPKLLYAVVAKESGGNPNAKSGAGAMGLAQLMPATARELGVLNPYDPEQNLEGAAKYLSQLQKLYKGDTSLMLAAYNSGMGNVRKAGYTVPKIKETQQYVATILDWLQGRG